MRLDVEDGDSSVRTDTALLLQRPVVPEEPVSKPVAAMLTVKQAARALGVHDQTVRAQLERKEQPGVRVGRVWRIPRRQFCEKNGIPDDYDFGEP